MDTLIQIANEIEFAACWRTFRQDLTKFNIRLPCCGFTLQNGMVVIAILDVVGAVIGILPLVIMLIALTVFRDLMKNIREDLTLLPMESATKETVENSFTLFLAILTLVICVSLLEFYLAMLLLNASKKKKLTSCYKWWRLAVVVLIGILFLIAAYVIPPYRLLLLVFGTILCLYKMYCYWIVSLFIDQIGTVPTDAILPTVCSETDNFNKI